MQFRHAHKAATYGMATSAVASVASSGEIPPAILVALASAFGISWFWESPRIAHKRYELGWNIASVLCLGYLGFLCFQPEGTLLSSGIYLLLFLLVNKLFNRQASRDYLQLGLIGFLLLLAGTAINTDLWYAICFFAFIVTATWHLTLLHLRREMEESELLRHADEASSEKVQLQRILDSRRIVGVQFLLGTGAMSVLIFIGALTVFFLFPRVGLGFFLSQSRRGQLLTGFSDRVDLGTHGVLRENPAVVMRVEFPGQDGEHLPPLHWRGIAFDQYERSGRWQHSTHARSPFSSSLLVASQGSGKSSSDTNDLLQAIYLEPLGSQVLFGATWPVSYKLPPSLIPGGGRFELQIGEEGDVYTTSRTAGFRYIVRSRLTEPGAQDLARINDSERETSTQRYLQVPDALSPRIAKLARELTRSVQGPYAKAQAITAYLRQNYKYTTHLGTKHATPDPLEEFLFETRAGHCEFFATALAILLRLADVPTREVHGFLGGEWNRWGHYLAVRQMDAHAWVEVWFEGSGWITFDPTPPGAALAPVHMSGLWNRLRQIEDSIELVWYKHMVEYDLGQQVKLARSTQRWFQQFTRSNKTGWQRPKLRPQILVGPLMIALGIFLILRVRSKRSADGAMGIRPAVRQRDPATLLYQKALRRCARKGVKRGPGETPLEFAESLALRAFPGAPLIQDITSVYYRSRFGREAVASTELRDLETRLRTL